MKISRISEGVLFEAGMARVVQHCKGRPFAVLTAFRANFSLAANRKRNQQLESRLREIGAGGIKVLGHWQESPDGTWLGKDYAQQNPDELIDTIEESYFIPMPEDMGYDEFRAWVLDVITQFSQDAAVFSDGVGVYLLDKADELTKIGDRVTVNKIAQAYSSMKWRRREERREKPDALIRPFVFEGTMRPSSIAHRMLLTKRGVFWV